MRKVDEAVREVISSALTSGISDPRLGFVTITGVDTSPDLRNAVVFVSVFGAEEERESSLEALEDLRPKLQEEIATHVRMKNTPKLRFVYDDSVDRSMRVSELINEEAEKFDGEGPR
jgi:ribosome-binding factor A